MITEDYICFETAKLLKEKGFKQECDYATSWYANQYYKNSCTGEWFEGEHQIIEDIDDKCNISYLSEKGIFIPAPTLQMAMKWLVQEHKLYVNVVPSVEGYYWTEKWHSYVEILNKRYPFGRFIATFNSPEEACEAAIKYCLENLI